jgi:hypothetical protein
MRKGQTISYRPAPHKRKYPIGFDTSSRLYRIWRAMLFRCYQPSHEAHARYSANGITVCDEWREDYLAFMIWAFVSDYDEHLELDRRDNDKGYTLDNCRWVTRREQARNRRNNLLPVEAFGESKTPIEWAEDQRCVIRYPLLMKRLKADWPVETALTTPSQAGGLLAIHKQPLGEARYGSRLTDQAVREIRTSAESGSVLGRRYGVSPSLVWAIKQRKVWRHVD